MTAKDVSFNIRRLRREVTAVGSGQLMLGNQQREEPDIRRKAAAFAR
jgi:hypothetical protein